MSREVRAGLASETKLSLARIPGRFDVQTPIRGSHAIPFAGIGAQVEDATALGEGIGHVRLEDPVLIVFEELLSRVGHQLPPIEHPRTVWVVGRDDDFDALRAELASGVILDLWPSDWELRTPGTGFFEIPDLTRFHGDRWRVQEMTLCLRARLTRADSGEVIWQGYAESTARAELERGGFEELLADDAAFLNGLIRQLATACGDELVAQFEQLPDR